MSGPAVLVGGDLTAEAAGKLVLKDKIVLYPLDFTSSMPEAATQVIRVMRLAGSRAVILLSNLDSASFAARVPQNLAGPNRGGGGATDRAGDRGRGTRRHEVSSGVGGGSVGGARWEDRGIAGVRGLDIRVELADSVLSSRTAPNTVGILEGSDPDLKNEYLVFSAHMDHIGITPGQPDSINNGADDDGSGTVGVVELAEAFSQAGARPKRSIIFLTVSGEEKGLWGSRYFTEHPVCRSTKVVADLNIDMIGRNWPDTIVAIGKEHSDLGTTLERVNARHKELGMTAIDDIWPEERFYFRSDHYNFARKGVPVLFFFNGVHADYHRVTDSPDKINSEKESRILRLLFYLGQDIANSPTRPAWKPASYKEIVEGEG